jgi:hypothetical protein
MWHGIKPNWLRTINSSQWSPRSRVLDNKGTVLARFPEPEKWRGKHFPDAALFEMLQLRSPNGEGFGWNSTASNASMLSNRSQLPNAVGHILRGWSGGAEKTWPFGRESISSYSREISLVVLFIALSATIIRVVDRHAGRSSVLSGLRAEAEEGAPASSPRSCSRPEDGDHRLWVRWNGIITSWKRDGAETPGSATKADEVKAGRIGTVESAGSAKRDSRMLGSSSSATTQPYETERLRKDGRRLYISASLSTDP